MDNMDIMGGILEFLEIPGVDALINIVLIFALVVVTAYYARKVHQQTELMRKDRERASIIELLCHVIGPSLSSLKYAKEELQNDKYHWYDSEAGIVQKTYLLIMPYTQVYFDRFLKRNPDFSKLFEEYKKKYEVLEERLELFKDKIAARYPMGKIEEMFKEFNEKNPDKRIDFHEDFYNPIILLIINNVETLRHGFIYSDFWDEYRTELLQVRNEEEIRKILESLNVPKTDLLKVGSILKNKFEEVREEYLEDYNITIEEIGLLGRSGII